MRWLNTSSPQEKAAYFQYSADALCDMRSDASSLIAKHIVSNPNYHSWGLAGLITLLHVTDKVDGRFAKYRDAIVKRLAHEQPDELLSKQLADAIANGGRKDDKADKRLNHFVFGAIAAREALNGHSAYASTIGACDATMFARDEFVGAERDKAAESGVKGDARQLGKIKQTMLVVTEVVAVSPLARPKEQGNFLPSMGRFGVMAGMIGGTALSIYSGVDQVRDLHHRQAELTV